MTKKHARTLFVVPVLIILSLLFALDLLAAPGWIFEAACLAAACAALSVAINLQIAYFLLGLGLLTLPFFGPGVLNLVVCGWLIGFEIRRPALKRLRSSRGQLAVTGAALMIVLLFMLSAGKTFALDFDLSLMSTIASSATPRELFAYLRSHRSSWLQAVLLIAGYLTALMLLSNTIVAERCAKARRPLVLGLAFGAVFSAVAAFLQKAGIAALLPYQRSPVWDAMGRYSGTLTDPNAFGVISSLVVPLLAAGGLLLELTGGRIAVRRLLTISAFILFISAPLSGSRTFFVGVALWLLAFGRSWLRKRRAAASELPRSPIQNVFLVGIAATLLATFAAVTIPAVNRALQEIAPSTGAIRMLKSLNQDEAAEMVHSRALYSRIALQVWSAAPVLGVGLGRFYGLQDGAARSLGEDLHGWKDNANNFYLQVLAEQGLLGLMSLLVAIYLMAKPLASESQSVVALRTQSSWSEQRSSEGVLSGRGLSGRHSFGSVYFIWQAALAIILILLLTGPHLFFDEVRYLVFLILGLCAAHAGPLAKRAFTNHHRILAATIAIAVVTYAAYFAQGADHGRAEGFYEMESGVEGRFAWSGKHAEIALCHYDKPVVLHLRSLLPDVATKPVQVHLSLVTKNSSDDVTDFILSTNEWKEVPLDVAGLLPGQSAKDRVQLAIDVDRVWQPPGDLRWLGVMVRWPAEACEN